MNGSEISWNGKNIPPLLYGTAWKEEDTERLTRAALEAGFRAIDTANQRKHYHEEGVGRAVAAALADGVARREELFLQTKFTFTAGQDHRLPYDPRAPIATQVLQSFESSLVHLQTDVIDSYLLHGPSVRVGLAPADLEAWEAMEGLHDEGRVRALGVSNVGLEQLQRLWNQARIKPRFVQNRCFAQTGWDTAVRGFCRERGIQYQGFSLLTANTPFLAHPRMRAIASRLHATEAQVIFRFALEVGILPLTGTTNPDHMQQDLGVWKELALQDEERDFVEGIARRMTTW